jgi:hypothetical protein
VLDAFKTLCSWTDSPADSMPQQFGKRNRINAEQPGPRFRALLTEGGAERLELAKA